MVGAAGTYTFAAVHFRIVTAGKIQRAVYKLKNVISQYIRTTAVNQIYVFCS
jgi:hypothetical protein